MPTPKTQKMYNHVHKLSHLLVQSSSNGNSSKYSWKRYIALSAALRAVIPCMTMMEEINEVFPLHIDKPNFVCKVHEDNQSCIKMATGTKFSPRTKHIALKYHHFRSHVKKGRIHIRYKPSAEQLADILTKPLSNEAFFTLRYMLCGWGYNPAQKDWWSH